jgi:hypothetical protein
MVKGTVRDILRRLDAIEARFAAPETEDSGIATHDARRQLDATAARRRAQPGWRPPTDAQKAALFAKLEQYRPGFIARMAKAGAA